MKQHRLPIINCRPALRFILAGVSLFVIVAWATDALARVGGGQSYGGGGSSGGGGGGGLGALVYLLVRFLLWLTIEHPLIGIPVDIIVIVLVIYWFARPSRKSSKPGSAHENPPPI